jgi:hypothetical protein
MTSEEKQAPAARAWDGCRVFSATKAKDRAELGERVTAWLREAGVLPVDVQVRQSSDESFHCLSITVFYLKRPQDPTKEPRRSRRAGV